MYLQLGVVFVTLFQIVITEKCVTPNHEEAECVPISSCEILLDALFKAEQSDINEFVRKSKCEGREVDRMVCCGSTSMFLAPIIEKNDNKDQLLPDKTYCGYQHSDDYFRNETDTGINEFPWLAGLVYKNYKNETEIRCSGSLISNRYVLTAGYCIILAGKLVGVRLGEYNIKTDEDCTQDSGFYECSEPPQYFDIEKIIRHPQVNDIGLLRLSKKVQYSDYIRPICLPTTGTMLAKPGDILFSSGWGTLGKGENYHKRTDTKKKFLSKVITNEECAAAIPPIFVRIKENHLCTIELQNNTGFSCVGDTGAPVIFSFRMQWHQEGVDMGHAGCDERIPTVYAKVVNYVEWITENLEP